MSDRASDTAAVAASLADAPNETPPAEERFSVHMWMFGRTPDFTRRQWRVFLIAITAGFFDQYDRALISLALKQIGESLKIAVGRLSLMASVIKFGYLLSFLITPLADVFGRRRLLLYTIVAYTAFTGLSALAPNEQTFIIFQVLARAFAGAEGTIALVILVEEVDAGVRGWTIGLLGAISSVGYGIAALAFGFINVVPYGWRGLYALALIPLVLIIPLRRALPESHRFEETSHTTAHPSNILQPIMALFRAYPQRLILLLSVTFLGNMGGNAAGFYFPMYLQVAHGYSPGRVTSLYFLGGGIGIMGNIIVGRLSDRFGRRQMGSICFLLAPLMTIWMYMGASTISLPASIAANLPGWFPISISTVIPAWVLELFFDTASSTIFAAYSAELFPTSHRSTAGSALAIAGTTGGGIGFLLETLLYRYTHSHWTAVSYLTIFWIIGPFIMYFGFPETAGQELESISPEQRSTAEAV